MNVLARRPTSDHPSPPIPAVLKRGRGWGVGVF